jgi:FKBP-type peptidyl-prolyl cis-trans isomerase
MRHFFLPAAAAICLTFVAFGYSQDELPAAGGQQAAPRQAPGVPAANDAVYREQVCYALGRNFAQNLKQLEVELDMNALMAGITDVMQDQKPRWTDEQLGPCMERFSMEMQQKMQAKMKNMAAKNDQDAKAFLAQNAKREGVQTTPSGLQYRVIKEGDGASPTLDDTVQCNYRGTLLNGTEFDSSQAQGGPQTFPVRGVIAGWTEALQKMKVGDKWQLFVPPGLAYGPNPPGPPIEPNSLLVFEIELLDIPPQQ